MTQLQELRKQARERGLKGYSTLSKDNLERLLQGMPLVKKLKSNQVSVGTQTDFPPCKDCALTQLIRDHLMYKDDARQRRKTTVLDDMEIDVETGEVVGCAVEGMRWRYR